MTPPPPRTWVWSALRLRRDVSRPLSLLILGLWLLKVPLAAAPRVYWAGVSFSGDAASVSRAYPNCWAAYQDVDEATGMPLLEQRALRILKTSAPRNFEVLLSGFNTEVGREQIALGKGQALAMTLAVDGEFISVEKLSGCYSIKVWLSAEVLFFDFDARSVVACFPVGVMLSSASEQEPDASQLRALVRRMLVEDERPDSINLFDEFGRRIVGQVLKQDYGVRVQLGDVSLAEKAIAALPESMRSDAVAMRQLRHFVGNAFTKALSGKAGVPMLPFVLTEPNAAGGAALADAGLSMTILMGKVANGSVYRLRIPEPDYVFTLSVAGFKKVQFSKSLGSEKWIYGAYVDCCMTEPLAKTVLLEQRIVNLWYEDIPDGVELADWPSYRASLYQLLDKLGSNITRAPDKEWVRSQADKRLGEQIRDACKKLDLCL